MPTERRRCVNASYVPMTCACVSAPSLREHRGPCTSSYHATRRQACVSVPDIALASQLEGSRTSPMPIGPSLHACVAFLNPLSSAADSAVVLSTAPSTDQWHGPSASQDGPRWRRVGQLWLVPRPHPETLQVAAVVACRTVALTRVLPWGRPRPQPIRFRPPFGPPGR